jgi:hypothetical protein
VLRDTTDRLASIASTWVFANPAMPVERAGGPIAVLRWEAWKLLGLCGMFLTRITALVPLEAPGGLESLGCSRYFGLKQQRDPWPTGSGRKTNKSNGTRFSSGDSTFGDLEPGVTANLGDFKSQVPVK